MNKYKMLALNYCYDGKADLTGLTKEEIQTVLGFIQAYDAAKEYSKFFVKDSKRQIIIDCETLGQLVQSIFDISEKDFNIN